MTLLRQLWNDHRGACLGFLAGLAITVFFLLRLAMVTLHWADHRDVRPEGWMTPGFVAHSWQLPVGSVMEHLDVTRAPRSKPPTLAEIARSRGQSETALLAALEAWLESGAGQDGTP